MRNREGMIYTRMKKKCATHRICNKHFIVYPKIMNIGQIDILNWNETVSTCSIKIKG